MTARSAQKRQPTNAAVVAGPLYGLVIDDAPAARRASVPEQAGLLRTLRRLGFGGLVAETLTIPEPERQRRPGVANDLPSLWKRAIISGEAASAPSTTRKEKAKSFSFRQTARDQRETLSDDDVAKRMRRAEIGKVRAV